VQTPIANLTLTDGVAVGQPVFGSWTWNTDALAQNLTGHPVAALKASKPVCKANLSSSFSVPSGAGGTNQIVTWNQLIYDSDGMWTAGAGSIDHLVVQTAG
jgi:hypothetical protein